MFTFYTQSTTNVCTGARVLYSLALISFLTADDSHTKTFSPLWPYFLNSILRNTVLTDSNRTSQRVRLGALPLKLAHGYNGGELGIRTPGRVNVNGFQDRRLRPLSQLSTLNWRRIRVSNPGTVLPAYELSKPAPSASWVILHYSYLYNS